MDTVKCPVTGNILYVLNDKGIDLKARQLPSVLDKTFSAIFDICKGLSNNPVDSDVWRYFLSKGFVYDKFVSLMSFSDWPDTFYRYCVYRTVYQYRSYIDNSDIRLSETLHLDDIVADYSKFLTSNFYQTDYSDLMLITLRRRLDPDVYKPFSTHPVFVDYIEKFEVIELIYELWREYIGSLKRQSFADALQVRKGINAVKFSALS